MNHAKNIYNIAKREFISYISSPMMYIIYALFFFLVGIMFIIQLITFNDLCHAVTTELISLKISALDVNINVLSNFSKNIAFVVLFFLPITTMKLIVEERKNHTMELLMTSPVSSLDIITGKYFAALTLWFLFCICLILYPFILTALPNISIDWNMFFTSLSGIILYGSLGIAIGLFASTLTENSFISAFLGFVFMAILYFIIFVAIKTNTPFESFIYGISSYEHLTAFFTGVIDTSNIIYFLSSTTFVLFLTERILESQRWR